MTSEPGSVGPNGPTALDSLTGPPPSPVVQTSAAERAADLVLAGIHLRLGSLSLARAELETLAGRNGLDEDGIRDLAEARWRTGDLVGAGEAAAAHLEAVPDDVLCLVIAAESQANLGRPGEARRLAGRALERAGGPLDPVFAGQPRSPIWPIDPGMPAEPAATLFDDLHPGPTPDAASGGAHGGAGDAAKLAGPVPVDPGIPPVLHDQGPGFWQEADGDEPGPEPVPATTLFEQSRAALDGGRIGEAATGFVLALRAEPALAPALIELLAGRPEPGLLLVRGDAHRIVGQEAEALRDHATLAAALGRSVDASDRADAGAEPAETADFEPPAGDRLPFEPSLGDDQPHAQETP